MTPDQLDLVQRWHAAKQRLDAAALEEGALRAAVDYAMFGSNGDGSRTTDIGNGYKLRSINTTRYDVKDSPELRQLVRNFTAYEATADIGKALLKDKPRLSLRAYKALPQWGVNLMVPFVTSTPNVVQLSIIPPEK